MSRTFSLYCIETRQKIWIGQGRGKNMDTLYSGEPITMAMLARFLNINRGKHLVFEEDERGPDTMNEFEDLDDSGEGEDAKGKIHEIVEIATVEEADKVVAAFDDLMKKRLATEIDACAAIARRMNALEIADAILARKGTA